MFAETAVFPECSPRSDFAAKLAATRQKDAPNGLFAYSILGATKPSTAVELFFGFCLQPCF